MLDGGSTDHTLEVIQRWAPRLAGWRSHVEELAPMGFGHADLILAVPACWRDCETLDDFATIARDFRAEHGFRLRIATKYHRLVRAWLSDHEVADYQLVDSQGATEGTVANLTAEAIADIKTNFENGGDAYNTWLAAVTDLNGGLPGVVGASGEVVSTLPVVTVDSTAGATSGQVVITLFWRTPSMPLDQPGHRHIVTTQISRNP